MAFKRATKAGAWLRLALTGVSGSGKTYTALSIATALVPGGRIALIDTEHESASLYSDAFAFDAQNLEEFEPANYIALINEAVRERYDVLVIDSLSHGWMGAGGILDQLDNAKRNFNKWKDLTPQQNALVDAIIRADIHIIATMRSKQEYAVERDEKGKPTPRKLGLAPIQRDGTEYEFGVVLDIDIDHVATASKTRCPALDGKSFRKPGADVARILRAWLELDAGRPAPNAVAAPTPARTRTERDDNVPDGHAADAKPAALSVVERAKQAIEKAADARALLALAPNILKVSSADASAEIGAAYRDRWTAYVSSIEPDARRRVLGALGGMPAGIWEIADWSSFRELLENGATKPSNDGAADGATDSESADPSADFDRLGGEY